MPLTPPHTAPEETLAAAGAAGAAVAMILGVAIALAVADGAVALAVGAGAGLVALLGVIALPMYRLLALSGRAGSGNEMVVGMSMAALGLRVMVALIAFAVVRGLDLLPIREFAVGLAGGLVCALVAEMAAAARDPRFFWVDATATPSSRSDIPNGTPRRSATDLGVLRSDTERQLT